MSVGVVGNDSLQRLIALSTVILFAITCRSYPKSWRPAAIPSATRIQLIWTLLACKCYIVWKRVQKDAYQRFVLNVLQSPAGILRLNLSRKLLNSGMNFGVTVAAHLQAFCFRLKRIQKSDISMRCAGSSENSNTLGVK